MLNHELVPLDLPHPLDTSRRLPAEAAPHEKPEASVGQPCRPAHPALEGAPTYRELNRRADLLFRHLHRSGVLPEPVP